MGDGPLRLSGLGTLSLQAFGTMGSCPLRLLGPWDMVPGTLGHGPLRLSGPWDKVPGTLGPCPFKLLGPWDLVP